MEPATRLFLSIFRSDHRLISIETEKSRLSAAKRFVHRRALYGSAEKLRDVPDDQSSRRWLFLPRTPPTGKGVTIAKGSRGNERNFGPHRGQLRRESSVFGIFDRQL